MPAITGTKLKFSDPIVFPVNEVQHTIFKLGFLSTWMAYLYPNIIFKGG